MSKGNQSVWACPECGSKVEVWADIDACLNFEISSIGELTKKRIDVSDMGEPRCGLKCTKCDWESDGDGLNKKQVDMLDNVLEMARNIMLAEKRKKSLPNRDSR